MRKFIDNPVEPQSSPYGLLSVLRMLNTDDEKWSLGVEFEAVCGSVSRGFAPCTLPNDKESFEKFFAEADSVPLYSLMVCSLIAGQDDAELARKNHELGVQRALEEYFAATYFSHDDAVDTGTHADPVIALAKMLALWPHGVQPHVHVSVDVGVLLAAKGLVKFGDDGASLKTGERLSIGYGYKDGAGLTAEQGLLMVTGPTFGIKGGLDSYVANTVKENTHSILVEQNWLATPTCGIITGTLTIT